MCVNFPGLGDGFIKDSGVGCGDSCLGCGFSRFCMVVAGILV